MIVGQVSATLNLNKHDNVVIYARVVGEGNNLIRRMTRQNRRISERFDRDNCLKKNNTGEFSSKRHTNVKIKNKLTTL